MDARSTKPAAIAAKAARTRETAAQTAPKAAAKTSATAAKTRAAAQKEAMVRDVLARVADKWTLLVIEELGSGGEMRFTRLRDRLGNVSQKMLTKTLRDLERDGLVTRRVHAIVPPRVDYKLTKLGEELGEAVCGIWTWVERYARDVERARQAYERRTSP
jgi:DNA-binding HxlR family transcriptional regulator